MTKTQVKARLAKIKALLEEAQIAMDELAEDVQTTIDEIEPYENHDDLTEQQYERQEWLENVSDTLEDKASDLTDMIYDIEYLDD